MLYSPRSRVTWTDTSFVLKFSSLRIPVILISGKGVAPRMHLRPEKNTHTYEPRSPPHPPGPGRRSPRPGGCPHTGATNLGGPGRSRARLGTLRSYAA